MTPRSWEYSGPKWRRPVGMRYVQGHEWDDATREELVSALDAAARENDWLAERTDAEIDDLHSQIDELTDEVADLREQLAEARRSA